MLVSKNAKICITPNANAKISVTPNANPNTSQWNIGWVGSLTQNLCISHVHFSFLVSISFALGPVFQWNMGLRVSHPDKNDFRVL